MDPKRVAVAEPCRDVSSVINDKIWCWQFATVKQSVLFHRNHKEHKTQTSERHGVINKFLVCLFELLTLVSLVSVFITSYNNRDVQY